MALSQIMIENSNTPPRPSTLFSFSSSSSLLSLPAGSGPVGLTPELKSALDDFLAKHRVVAFIKGTKDFPQCGFSNTVVQILSSAGVPFETVDVLADERLRSSLKEYSVSAFIIFERLGLLWAGKFEK